VGDYISDKTMPGDVGSILVEPLGSPTPIQFNASGDSACRVENHSLALTSATTPLLIT
jgi:hypothetical protein